MKRPVIALASSLVFVAGCSGQSQNQAEPAQNVPAAAAPAPAPPATPAADPERGRRYETIQWVMWQMAHVGPMFGQVGFFYKFAGRHWEDKRPLERYAGEARRLLKILDARLHGRDWLMGSDYTIADIALLGWVRNLVEFYEAADLVDYHEVDDVHFWLERCLARPAVQRGLQIPSRP